MNKILLYFLNKLAHKPFVAKATALEQSYISIKETLESLLSVTNNLSKGEEESMPDSLTKEVLLPKLKGLLFNCNCDLASVQTLLNLHENHELNIKLQVKVISMADAQLERNKEVQDYLTDILVHFHGQDKVDASNFWVN